MKIPIIIVADNAPVLPSSNVDASARGISATITEKIIKLISFYFTFLKIGVLKNINLKLKNNIEIVRAGKI